MNHFNHRFEVTSHDLTSQNYKRKTKHIPYKQKFIQNKICESMFHFSVISNVWYIEEAKEPYVAFIFGEP